MDKRYQVFISSTYADLSEERKSVIQTLMEMDCIPSGMELFPAADEDQWQFIKKIIDDCDYYLLIIGGRYGSLTPEGLSYTEKEYEYAKEIGLKIVALIHDKPEDLPRKFADKDSALQIKLQAFRDKVATGRMVKFWNDPKLLPGMVSLSLGKTIRTYPAVGWVRADQVSNIDLLNELNELRKLKDDLEIELKDFRDNAPNSPYSKQEENEFKFIYESLKGEHRALCYIFETGAGKGGRSAWISYSLLKILYEKSLLSPEFSVKTLLGQKVDYVINSESFAELNETNHHIGSILPSKSVEGILRSRELLTVAMSVVETSKGVQSVTKLLYSNKAYKFLNWLESNNKFIDEISIKFDRFTEKDEEFDNHDYWQY